MRTRGTGALTTDGYIRVKPVKKGKYEMQHRYVWRKHYGPIPPGFEIHHKDENKQNNVIENLELVESLYHRRLHAGCELRDGVWWKKCKKCGVFKELKEPEWYISIRGWPLYSACRICHNHRTSIYKRELREQQRKLAEFQATTAVSSSPSPVIQEPVPSIPTPLQNSNPPMLPMVVVTPDNPKSVSIWDKFKKVLKKIKDEL